MIFCFFFSNSRCSFEWFSLVAELRRDLPKLASLPQTPRKPRPTNRNKMRTVQQAVLDGPPPADPPKFPHRAAIPLRILRPNILFPVPAETAHQEGAHPQRVRRMRRHLLRQSHVHQTQETAQRRQAGVLHPLRQNVRQAEEPERARQAAAQGRRQHPQVRPLRQDLHQRAAPQEPHQDPRQMLQVQILQQAVQLEVQPGDAPGDPHRREEPQVRRLRQELLDEEQPEEPQGDPQ